MRDGERDDRERDFRERDMREGQRFQKGRESA
jgi:hypothetical protein